MVTVKEYLVCGDHEFPIVRIKSKRTVTENGDVTENHYYAAWDQFLMDILREGCQDENP